MNISTNTTATITLNIGEQSFILSIEDAKKVRDSLNVSLVLFEPKKEKETVFRDMVKKYNEDYPAPKNPTPYFRPEIPPIPPFGYPQIWCLAKEEQHDGAPCNQTLTS